ncbi:MAG: hypothetical protein WBQ25_06030 [Nitrososphaeraceae archaeon]
MARSNDVAIESVCIPIEVEGKLSQKERILTNNNNNRLSDPIYEDITSLFPELSSYCKKVYPTASPLFFLPL